MTQVILYIIVFLYGTILGSFLNVLIYRLPNKENITFERSHCMTCGKQIKWYDLIPVLSFVLLKGRCRYCGEKISVQYPIIELTNGVAYTLIFLLKGISLLTVLFCLVFSVFLTISIIDIRTYEIPFGLNICIFVLAAVRLILEPEHWLNRLIGFVSVSGFMLLCLFIGRLLKGIDAFGGGDIKLMAAAGLFLGAEEVILGFVLGCILGAVIHSIRMRVSDAEHVLAFGPYLCGGLLTAMLFGERLISWYLGFI